MTEYEKMIQLLDTSYYMRDQIVPCLVGPPGIGKTAAVMQHAGAHGCGKVVKIVASRCVPSETVGMTMPNHEHRSMEIYNSMQLSSLEDGDILFLDELLEADQYVLSTLLTVIESREMADGTPLPDIQIVAATNDTIPPEQLKGNIRQRFMFMRFGVDGRQTARYIRKRTGLELPDYLIQKLTDVGTDYNFLTPRTLTKLCMWVCAAPEDKVPEVAAVIDGMFHSMIGSDIAQARNRRDHAVEAPDQQVRKAVMNIFNENDELAEGVPDDFNFSDSTPGELFDMLQKLPGWSTISTMLAGMTIEEGEEETDRKLSF